MKQAGSVVLAIWLLIYGLSGLLRVSIPGEFTLLGVLALVAGVLLLIDALRTRLEQLGMTLLALWLMAEGAIRLLKIQFAYSGELLAVVALASGLLLLAKR